MTTAAQDAPRGGLNLKLIVALVGVGFAAAIVVAAFLFLNSKPSPEDLAQEHIDENSSALAREVADYLAAGHWILGRLDRESFAKQVQGSLRWEQLPARPLGDDLYEVIAVASVSVGVSSPWAGTVEAIVPFVLTIDLSSEAVIKSELDHSRAQFGTDLPTLEEVLHDIAEKYISDRIDAMGEQIALFIVGGNWLLKELGGEYVEGRIHDIVEWEYQPPSALGGDRYEVVAISSVGFSVDLPSGVSSVEAGLPFVLEVDLASQMVESAKPDILNAYLRTDIPDLASFDVSAGEVVNFVRGTAGVTQEVTDSAREALDETKDKAAEAVEEVLEFDCIGAAREAGVPENILELIQKPKDERSGIENSILRRGLEAVGLSEACSDVR